MKITTLVTLAFATAIIITCMSNGSKDEQSFSKAGTVIPEKIMVGTFAKSPQAGVPGNAKKYTRDKRVPVPFFNVTFIKEASESARQMEISGNANTCVLVTTSVSLGQVASTSGSLNATSCTTVKCNRFNGCGDELDNLGPGQPTCFDIPFGQLVDLQTDSESATLASRLFRVHYRAAMHNYQSQVMQPRPMKTNTRWLRLMT